MFSEAGNLFKISKNWKAAGDAYKEAAEAEIKRDVCLCAIIPAI